VTENEVQGEWPLPDGWVWTTIGDITQAIEQVKPRENPNTPFIYLDISSIDNTIYKIVDPKTYQGAEAPSRARQLVDANDVLFSTVRTYLKNIALVPEAYDGQIASTGFSVLRTQADISPKYLFYYSLTDRFVNELGKLQRGTSYPAVRDSDVRVQLFPLAPLPEQRRIVAEIETQFTRLDAGVAALERAQANLKRYRTSVLKAACAGRLVPTEAELARAHSRAYEPADQLLARILAKRRTKWEAEHPGKKYKEPAPPDTEDLPELPEGWAYSLIEPLLSTSRSGMKTGPFGSLLKKHEHRPEGIPVLGIENIGPTGYVPGNRIFITERKADQLSKYDIQPNDILISRSGTVGEVCIVPEGLGSARFSTNLMRIALTPNSMLSKFFRFLFNGSPFVLDQVSELCSGSTRDFLNQKILKSVVFLLPPLAEQRRIVAEVERRLSVVAALEREVEAALARAARLRQSILKRAFEGRLVPQDPNDEPASVLLARIRAERKAGTGKGSGKKKRKPEKPQQLEMF
jgi:type I restriction enzyme S subunit